LQPDTSKRRLRIAKIGAVLLVVVMLLVAHRFGILAELCDPPHVRQALLDLGAWGAIAFVLTYALIQPFGIPGTVFVIAASLVWPWAEAFALSMIGTMAATTVGFSFSRFVARDWVSGIVPARFRRYDDALARRAFTTVFLLRLVFWMAPLLNAFFGVSKVRFATHFWASLLGYIVPLILISIFGERLFDYARHAPLEAWLATAGVLALALAVFIRLRQRHRTPAAE
jgi:uncharacterized membrane protein YdjX (TVP38/TMEM64 family)